MSRKSTIGESPLDLVLGGGGRPATLVRERAIAKEATQASEAIEATQVTHATQAKTALEAKQALQAKIAKKAFTVRLPEPAVEKLRDVVFWTPGMTTDDLALEAIEAYIAQLEKERGEAFPKRGARLRPGRPVR